MLEPDRRAKLLRNLELYRGFVFRRQGWRLLREDWTHDHCKGCWARFSEFPEDRDALNNSDRNYKEGWVTLWPIHDPAMPTGPIHGGGFVYAPSPKPGGYQLDWLCEECFEAIREQLQLIVDPDHPQWKLVGL